MASQIQGFLPYHTFLSLSSHTNLAIIVAHLSKRPCDLMKNGTQEKTPFSSTVFNAYAHGVIRFVASVSSKNHLLAG